MIISMEVLDHTRKCMAEIAHEWHEEIPTKLHTRDLDSSGAPAWSRDFVAWAFGSSNREQSDKRFRLTQAMRRLRRRSIREFEVAYRMIILQEPIDATTRWLNDRAIRNDKPERYNVEDTQVIIVSAVDKLMAWY